MVGAPGVVRGVAETVVETGEVPTLELAVTVIA
jgi:hypothetical protein